MSIAATYLLGWRYPLLDGQILCRRDAFGVDALH